MEIFGSDEMWRRPKSEMWPESFRFRDVDEVQMTGGEDHQPTSPETEIPDGFRDLEPLLEDREVKWNQCHGQILGPESGIDLVDLERANCQEVATTADSQVFGCPE